MSGLTQPIDQVQEQIRKAPRVPSFAHLDDEDKKAVWADLVKALYTGKVSERLWHAVHIAVLNATTEEQQHGG